MREIKYQKSSPCNTVCDPITFGDLTEMTKRIVYGKGSEPMKDVIINSERLITKAISVVLKVSAYNSYINEKNYKAKTKQKLCNIYPFILVAL